MVRCCNRLAVHAAAAATVVVVVVVVHILKEAVLRKSRVHRNMDNSALQQLSESSNFHRQTETLLGSVSFFDLPIFIRI
jgi:hypothetical protein